MKTSNAMTRDELLRILKRDRRITVTAESIDAVRWIIRNDAVTLRRKQLLKAEAAMKIYGVVNHLIELPRSAEPQVGDFLHVNDIPPPKKPEKKKK